jgi:hypothetical protein
MAAFFVFTSEPVPPFRKGGLGGIFGTWRETAKIHLSQKKSPPAPLFKGGSGFGGFVQRSGFH